MRRGGRGAPHEEMAHRQVSHHSVISPIVSHSQVSIWRPLNGPVKSMPLALCDSRSLASDDITESDIVLPHLQIQAYEVWYNPQQKWYYLKHQTSDEIMIMMSADSETPIR